MTVRRADAGEGQLLHELAAATFGLACPAGTTEQAVTTGTKAWELFRDDPDVIAARVNDHLRDLAVDLVDLGGLVGPGAHQRPFRWSAVFSKARRPSGVACQSGSSGCVTRSRHARTSSGVLV